MKLTTEQKRRQVQIEKDLELTAEEARYINRNNDKPGESSTFMKLLDLAVVRYTKAEKGLMEGSLAAIRREMGVVKTNKGPQ